ncbi:MAG: flagellar hook-basal body complex protein FliE [Thalassobaculales bacterium]
MVGRISDAIAAYTNLPKAPEVDGPKTAGAPDFESLLKEAAGEAVKTMKEGERQSILAAQGKADLTDVVMAVNNAEVTLQTVVGLRDRMVQAYQEIIRMPI